MTSRTCSSIRPASPRSRRSIGGCAGSANDDLRRHRARRAKRRVLDGSLRADVDRLARAAVTTIARADRTALDDWTSSTSALVEFIAALPVYRTYVDARTPPSTPADRDVIERASRGERHRDRRAERRSSTFIADVLLGADAGADEAARASRSRSACSS